MNKVKIRFSLKDIAKEIQKIQSEIEKGYSTSALNRCEMLKHTLLGIEEGGFDYIFIEPKSKGGATND